MFFATAVVGGNGLVSLLVRFTAKGGAPGTRWIGGRAGWTAEPFWTILLDTIGTRTPTLPSSSP
jgi:hypothetical protein